MSKDPKSIRPGKPYGPRLAPKPKPKPKKDK